MGWITTDLPKIGQVFFWSNNKIWSGARGYEDADHGTFLGGRAVHGSGRRGASKDEQQRTPE
jgi:hypothetical protein